MTWWDKQRDGVQKTTQLGCGFVSMIQVTLAGILQHDEHKKIGKKRLNFNYWLTKVGPWAVVTEGQEDFWASWSKRDAWWSMDLIQLSWDSWGGMCWHRLVIWAILCHKDVWVILIQYLYWSPYEIMNFWTIFRYLYCLFSTYGLSFVSFYQDTSSSCNSISWCGSTVF